MIFVLHYLDYPLLWNLVNFEGLPTNRIELLCLCDITPLTLVEMADWLHLNLRAIWAFLVFGSKVEE
jgi:hypothetical protein